MVGSPWGTVHGGSQEASVGSRGSTREEEEPSQLAYHTWRTGAWAVVDGARTTEVPSTVEPASCAHTAVAHRDVVAVVDVTVGVADAVAFAVVDVVVAAAVEKAVAEKAVVVVVVGASVGMAVVMEWSRRYSPWNPCHWTRPPWRVHSHYYCWRVWCYDRFPRRTRSLETRRTPWMGSHRYQPTDADAADEAADADHAGGGCHRAWTRRGNSVDAIVQHPRRQRVCCA